MGKGGRQNIHYLTFTQADEAVVNPGKECDSSLLIFFNIVFV